LARAIVEEAGIAQGREQAAQLERDKARAEYFKTMLLLSTASLAGTAAVSALMPKSIYKGLLFTALAFILGSICGAWFGLHFATIT
jgi:hypothetical protein